MGKAVTRHLTYAWIEYGDPRDGAAFTDGLYGMGWKNALHGFPTVKDRLGVRYVDASHPLLPIRFRGSGLLICPNDRLDRHSHDNTPNPILDESLYKEFLAAHEMEAFNDAIEEQNNFIADWVFRPGIKRVSPSESHLTSGGDITDHCDLVAISGHGASGTVWGGGLPANLKNSAFSLKPPATDRLKYVIIASCMNLMVVPMEYWLPPMRRKAPVHGMFGYQHGYPGDQIGEAVFRRFCASLKAGSTVLKSWRDAHEGAERDIWAALMHTESAKNDTMPKWMAGQLESPDPDGEIRSYNAENYPEGEVYKPLPVSYSINFMMGSTKIDRFNSDDSRVGLIPGDQGNLRIERTDGKQFNKADTFKIVFYYYRHDKDGMNLNTLLAFGNTPDASWELIKDANRDDRSTFTDAISVKIAKSGLTRVDIPYTVLSKALDFYPVDGPGHGYFNLHVFAETDWVYPEDHQFYLDGAWLKPRKA